MKSPLVKIRKVEYRDNDIYITVLEDVAVGTYLGKNSNLWKVEGRVSYSVIRLSTFDDQPFLKRGEWLYDYRKLNFSLALDSNRNPILDKKIPTSVFLPVYQCSFDRFDVYVDADGPHVIIEDEMYPLEYGPNWYVPGLAKK